MSPTAQGGNTEQRAQGLLAEGKHCLSAGRRGRAEMWLRDVLDYFPGTAAAGEAERLLRQPR